MPSHTVTRGREPRLKGHQPRRRTAHVRWVAGSGGGDGAGVDGAGVVAQATRTTRRAPPGEVLRETPPSADGAALPDGMVSFKETAAWLHDRLQTVRRCRLTS